MTARPPDGSGPGTAADPVMLAVLANRGRRSAALLPDEEKLLDAWVAGGLDPEAAARAAVLVKDNALAAERVLERRLLLAASHSPLVPQGLSARIVGSPADRPTPQARRWWPALGRWQWMGVAGAIALASILAIAVMPLLQSMRAAPIQVAMLTIGDRDALFEPSDIRRRGGASPSPVDQRFRDIELPRALLERLLASTGPSTDRDAVREMAAYLPVGAQTGGSTRLILDAALKQALASDRSRNRVMVRLYDLTDPRAAELRKLIAPLPDDGRVFLLTVAP